MKRLPFLNLFVSFLLIFCSCEKSAEAQTNFEKPEGETLAAFTYLNQVRSNPAAYSTEIGSPLGNVVAREALVWNKILAKVAYERAKDMATRKYFAHVDPDGKGTNIKMHNAGYTLPADWINPVNLNYFESIGAGYPDGKKAIIELINDGNVPNPGHRNHLLGISDFWANCKDVGIGFYVATGAPYKTYICVLIAKHNF